MPQQIILNYWACYLHIEARQFWGASWTRFFMQEKWAAEKLWHWFHCWNHINYIGKSLPKIYNNKTHYKLVLQASPIGKNCPKRWPLRPFWSPLCQANEHYWLQWLLPRIATIDLKQICRFPSRWILFLVGLWTSPFDTICGHCIQCRLCITCN